MEKGTTACSSGLMLTTKFKETQWIELHKRFTLIQGMQSNQQYKVL